MGPRFPFSLLPFPSGSAYALAIAAYLLLVLMVLAVALPLAMLPITGRVGRWLAGGAIGTFPFMLLFQLLSFVIIAIIFGMLAILPSGLPAGVTVTVVLTLAAAVFVAASISGCIVGWGVGARITSGVAVGEALRGSYVLGLLAAGLSRVLPVSGAITPERALAISVGAVLLAGGGLLAARMAYVAAFGSAEITYRGEKFRLAKKYVDYDDYRNDAGNLDPSEIPRIERMMTATRIGPEFADWKDFVDRTYQIRFPGYGGSGLRPQVAAGGREFIIETIEIPQVANAKHRYFILEKTSGRTLRLVDDFVMEGKLQAVRRTGFIAAGLWAFATAVSGLPGWWAAPAISSIRLADDRLVYVDRDGQVVRETPVAQQR